MLGRRFLLEELDARIVPTFQNNQLFPLDNPWNQVVANAPVSASSSAIIGAIVARHNGTPHIHADFGNPDDGNLYGIPVNVVDHTVPKVTVVLAPDGYGDESDIVQVPIPANAVIEGDGPDGPSDPSDPSARGDSHLLIYDKDTNFLYELGSAARPNEASYPYGDSKPLGVWGAWQISFWDLNQNSFRPINATSADAAGLPILPGLLRPDEVNAPVGEIDHAIRMTVQRTRDSFVFPASHEASNHTEANLPRMGERFRLKASFVIPSDWSPEAKAIAQAMKTYGMIVADNGSDFYFQGTPDDRWNMDHALEVQSIKATDFEVVDLTPAVTKLSVSSADISGGRSITITGLNFSGAAGQLHVMFGNVEASSVTIVSDSTIIAKAPAHAAGTVDLRVQSGTMRDDTDGNSVFFGYGTSAIAAADKFTFGSLPTANADAYSILHDHTLSVTAAKGVRINDTSNPTGHVLTTVVSTGPAHGTLTLYTNGAFVYKPNLGYSGSDSFTYTAKDGLLASDPATVNLTITDQAPVALGESYTIAMGKTLSVAAKGVLKNDTDPDGDLLTAALVNSPAHGSITLKVNGSFIYTPSAGFTGNDSFTYRANDKALNSADTTVTISVVPPPQVKSVVINGGSAQRSRVTSITITFDTVVTFDAGAILLYRTGGGAPTQTRQISTINGETQVVLTFSGAATNAHSLADGNWTLKIIKARVHRQDYHPSTMAADSVTTLYRYFGDADGDRDVDATDQGAFDAAVGHTDAVSLATFDFDGDGDVDTADRTQFNLRFGHAI